MNHPRVASPSEFPVVRRRWWYAGAAAVAVGLLSSYVGLLHDAIARGDQMREMQRSAPGASFTASVDARSGLAAP